MYGGGFATIPAYLKGIFGVDYVGAIHGRLLTACAAAGVFGPVLVNYIRQYQVDHGVAKANAFTVTMYFMAALLFVGFLCNYFMTPVDRRHHLNEQGPRLEGGPFRGNRNPNPRHAVWSNNKTDTGLGAGRPAAHGGRAADAE